MTTAASENPANRVKPYLMSSPPWVVSSPHERLQARCHRASTPAIPNTTTTRARLAAGKEIASDDDTLDLVGALVDLRDLGVAYEALHRVLARVAVAAGDLHGVGGRAHGGVGGEALGHGRLQRGAGDAVIDQRGGVMHHEPRAVHLHRHVGQHELHALEVGDGAVELPPLLGVLDGGA